MKTMQQHKERLILSIACLLVISYLFAHTICIPALYDISQDFAIEPKTAHHIIILYNLGLGLSQLVYGPLSDIYGRRGVVLCASLLFIAGSILALIASSINEMLFARLLQGLGAGCYSVIAKLLLRDTHDNDQYINATSRLMISAVLTQLITPVLGGYLVAALSWRANFAAILGSACFVFTVILLLLPETKSLHLVAPASVCLVLDNYLRVLRRREFLHFLIISAVTLAAITLYHIISPFILQTQFGLTSVEFGSTFLLTNSGFLVSCFLIPTLNSKIGVRNNILLGLSFMLVGSASMFFLVQMSYIQLVAVIIPMFIFNIGTGIVFPVCSAKALVANEAFPGAASAVIGALQMLIVASVGLILSVIAIDSTYMLSLLLLIATTLAIGVHRLAYL